MIGLISIPGESMPQKKVLLVDDVELFIDLEKTFLVREEVTLLTARTGRQAVDLAIAELPDLIFMDLFMPEMNGDEACSLIKQHPQGARIPVVMVTHGGRDEDLDFCRAAGCDDILFKPVNRNQFLDTVRHYLHVAERCAPRVNSRLSVHYGEGRTRRLHNFSVNISTGGLFLETDQPLPVGTPMTLEFPLPGHSQPVTCKAQVAWVNEPDAPRRLSLPSGMGMQFLDLSLENLQAIRDFVKQECLAPTN